MIDVTVLGTAALMPIPERALSSALLRCSGRSILFDCGEGTQTAARRAGVSLMKTDVIAITHYHGDHIFGIPGLLQTMSVMGRTDRLYITGPGNIARELAPILRLAGPLAYEISLFTLPDSGMRLSELIPGWREGARLTPFKTDHRVASRGYSFTLSRAGKFLPERALELHVPQNQWKLLQGGEAVTVGDRTVEPAEVLGPPRKGLKVSFTGDTAYCAGLVEGARDADLLISDATYGDDAQAQAAADYGHMTFSLAARAAREANVRELWLTHFSQMMEDPEVYLPAARGIFPNTLCAHDGMGVTLRFEE